MPEFHRPFAPYTKDSDPCDFCIVVDGEEVQCNHDFQCPECGSHRDAESPARSLGLPDGAWVRTCDECLEEFPVVAFSEEK
jgi:anaerobic ribonucleoside-triphosphate reductase